MQTPPRLNVASRTLQRTEGKGQAYDLKGEPAGISELPSHHLDNT